MESFAKAIALNKFEGKFYFNRAQVKAKLEKYEDAIKDYDKIAQLNPEGVLLYLARYNKGICLRKIGLID
jgi:tetratricopeptide (TPR) repeat protein